jgi:hypothetical protein
MANGFVDRVKGKMKIGALWLGTGGITDAASGISGKVVCAIRLSLPVTAVASTPFTLSLPTGATIVSATVYTSTAYAAATNAFVEIGSAAAGQQYVAQTSIQAAGVVALTFAATAAAAAAMASLPAGTPNLFVTVVQTGAASATGAATLVIEYTSP